jgi:hypothetical protein
VGPAIHRSMIAPEPALKRLQRLVGTWGISGRTLDSAEDNIIGRMTCVWLLGGFFLEQRSELDFKGLRAMSLEIIGYDPVTQTFPSTVYSNISGAGLPYHWDIQGDVVTHWTEEDRYSGRFSADGRTLTGGWRPVSGREGVTYDAIMRRID